MRRGGRLQGAWGAEAMRGGENRCWRAVWDSGGGYLPGSPKGVTSIRYGATMRSFETPAIPARAGKAGVSKDLARLHLRGSM